MDTTLLSINRAITKYSTFLLRNIMWLFKRMISIPIDLGYPWYVVNWVK